MKRILTILFLVAAGAGISATAKPVIMGDPFIMLYDGVYYAYGTNAPDGICFYTSNDLQEWEYKGLALKRGDAWGEGRFWAPEVYNIDGKFYMYYSADEHVSVAVSDSPSGPFVNLDKEPMITGEKCIDNTLFIDEDGVPYMFFDRFNDGLNIWVVELDDDLMTIKPETMHQCIHVSQNWEQVWPRVNEGPFVIKHKGLYYMLYSANNYQSPYYGIGCATAEDIMGEWTKYSDNPILQNPGELEGTGHGALFTDKEGKLRYVFHAHKDKSHIHPRAMHIADVSFEADNGVDKIRISSDYMTPFTAGNERQSNLYHNPVVNKSLPDPSVIRADDGYFYLYATEDTRNLPIYRSSDLADWKFVRTAFTDLTRPDFEEKGGLWAPDINKIGDKYVLYYSMSVWGGEWTCGIGCAVSDKPEGPFTDHGKMFRSNEIGVQNSIDPFYIEDAGHKYLFWGSFSGIYAVELSDDGLSVKSGEKPLKVAGTAFEGTCIYKKNGYYYLFASIGSCCAGLKSTYTTVVGRSDNLFGPYTDKKGRPMMDNHYEVLIHKSDTFVGTGHCSEVVTDDAGNDWLLYHAVRVNNPKGRVLMLDQLKWKGGWPYVEGAVPSLEAPKPVFK